MTVTNHMHKLPGGAQIPAFIAVNEDGSAIGAPPPATEVFAYFQATGGGTGYAAGDILTLKITLATGAQEWFAQGSGIGMPTPGTVGPVGGAQTAVDATVVNFPATQVVSGPLTDAQLRLTPVSVSGGLTDAQLRATAIPVSGPLTDGQLRASSVAVSGPLTDGQLRASAVSVSGPLTDTQLRNAPLAVSQSIFSKKVKTSVSGMIAQGGVAQQLIAADGLTYGYQLFNPNSAPGSLYLNESGTASTTAGVEIPPGRFWESSAHTCPSNAVSVYSATTGHVFVCWAF